MKRTLLFTMVLLIVLAVTAQPVAAQEGSLTPNESLVMNWIDASVWPDKVEIAAKDMFAPDFVFYGANDNMILDADHFIEMEKAKDFLPAALNCVVKGEYDLVQASYVMLTPGLREMPRTILFRIEDGRIAEAWLGLTL